MIENFENVGFNFVFEVWKIYYGDVEECNIYGEVMLNDVMDLIEEGIFIFFFLDLLEDKN